MKYFIYFMFFLNIFLPQKIYAQQIVLNEKFGDHHTIVTKYIDYKKIVIIENNSTPGKYCLNPNIPYYSINNKFILDSICIKTIGVKRMIELIKKNETIGLTLIANPFGIIIEIEYSLKDSTQIRPEEIWKFGNELKKRMFFIPASKCIDELLFLNCKGITFSMAVKFKNIVDRYEKTKK